MIDDVDDDDGDNAGVDDDDDVDGDDGDNGWQSLCFGWRTVEEELFVLGVE